MERDGRMIGPEVAERLCEPNEVDLVAQRRSREAQRVVDVPRQGEQRGSEIEREAVAFVRRHLAAERLVALEHDDVAPRGAEADRRHDSAETRSDDDDVAHGNGSRRRGRHDTNAGAPMPMPPTTATKVSSKKNANPIVDNTHSTE